VDTQQIIAFIKEKKIPLLFGVIVLLVVFSLPFSSGSQQAKPAAVVPSPTGAKPLSTGVPQAMTTSTPVIAVADVGKEVIYQADLGTERAAYPIHDANADTLLQGKLVEDSIILQAARDEGLITLDSTIFNSPAKSYAKRIEAVEQVKSAIEKKVAGIGGTVVNVWFLNDYVGPLGYSKAKEVAFQKITDVHEKVKNKQMTMVQAAEVLRQDKSLAQLDPQYLGNISYNFSVSPNEQISWEPAFDGVLWQLPVGGVSEIFVGKSRDLGQNGVLVDAYYMFGQVTKKVSDGPASFQDWLQEKKNTYEVTYR